MSVSYSIEYIKSTIVPGSVYYYHESSLPSSKQHYFVVLNVTPSNDNVLLLVCSRSNTKLVREMRKDCLETIVEISPLQYSEFTKPSIIDCNDYWLKSINQIANMLRRNKLQTKQIMGLRLVAKLREAVILSKEVPEEVKNIIKD